MLAKNKKGMSEIVVTIIIILLAIVVFAVVSVVVKGTVSKGAENIELASACLEVEMHAVKIAQSMNGDLNSLPIAGSFDVTVSRSSSGKDLDGVKLIVENAAKENSVNSEDLIGKIKTLDKKTFVVSGIDFTPAQVTVVPFFMKKSGEIFYCENTHTDELVVEA
ncbi:hypothetical protein HYS72_02650 [Candidatus Pacearchaeota archaeon]|nr:hypothetical protein [Candidatus Pacearchaeota archaeon]MBI2057122.1 hypothetical protein [Candidatus Pacearchaeota archaeon]